MKKLTSVLIVFSLLLIAFICIPQFSDAQKLKPGIKDIKKPGVSKSIVKKPGLSNSAKSQLPALELSRLALDSGCKITGFLQNKGSKMDARHLDFSKLEIKVGYIFDGKTKEVLLATSSGGTAKQPRLLKGATDLRNFTQGKPAKFTSKLKVPATGKGFAIIFAEVDPNNRIRETRTGEQRKRIQARLRSRCASRGPSSIKVNPPKKIKESVNSATSRVVKPPSAVSSPQGTGRVYQDFGIKVTHPNTARVGDNVTIKYQFSRSSSFPDEIRITLKGFCKKADNGKAGEFPIAHIYKGSPRASHRVNLSTIDFGSVGIQDICQGAVKFFFEVSEVREVGATSTTRVWGYSKHFTYLSNTFVKPGSNSKKLGKSSIKIDPGTKKEIKVSPNSKFNGKTMVTKGDGDPVGIIVLSPSTMQVIDLTRENAHIPVEFEYVNPPGDEARVLTFRFIAYNESGGMEEDKNVSNPDGWSTSGDIVTAGGALNLSMRDIPESDLIYNYKYRLQITCHSNVGVVAQGFSELFVIRDFRFRTERVEGIRFISPTIDQDIPQNEAIQVEYRYMSPVEGVVYTTFLLVGYDRTGDHSRVSGPSWNRRSGFDSNGGSFEIPWDQIPASYLLYDHYKILMTCYGGGNILAEGLSESFTLWGSYYDPLPVANGLSITSPASGDVIYTREDIDIQFTAIIPHLPEGARFLFWISKAIESDVSLKSVYELIPSDGSATLSTSGIRIGKYQIHGKAINSRGKDLVPGISGSSEVFRLEHRSRTIVDHGPGIDVTLPTATNVGSSGKINVSFEGGCDGATHRTITLHHLYYTSHADERYELHSGRMPTINYSQQFDIPEGCFVDDPTGDNSSFVIGVQGGYLDSAGNFVSLGSTCHGYSETFRLSQ